MYKMNLKFLCQVWVVKVKMLFLQVFSETMKTDNAERKGIEKQVSAEEDIAQKEALDR